MALENQPVFRAPSLPKMGKTTVSSSTFSNVAKSSYKPKLKSTKFQFKSPFQKQKAEKAEGLKTQIQGSAVTANVAATLGETNRILVEIQQQLALDFANRIAEKKQLLELSRRTALKQKAVKKEAFVERGKQSSGIGILGSKILAPTKGIFDKIIEFLSLVTTGIVINSAWKWLSKKENRDKLIKIFQFLREYWKQILGAFIAYKIITTIGKLVGFAKTLRKIFRRLRDLKGKGKFQKPPKPGSPEFCNPVVDCVKNAVTQGALSVALSAALLGHRPFIEGLKGKIGSTTTAPPPTTPNPVPDLQPVLKAIVELTTWAGTVWNLLKSLDPNVTGKVGPPPILPASVFGPAAKAASSQPIGPMAGMPESFVSETVTKKPTYEQIKANFNPSYDWSYYEKLGLTYGQWLKLQDEATSKPRGGYTAFATKPGETWGMALNALSFLPLFGMMGGGARVTTAAAPSVLRTTGANVAKNQIAKLPLNVNIGTSKILNSPNLSQKFLQFLKQNKAFTRSGSDPRGLNTIDDFAQFSGTTTENLIRSQYKNFLEYVTKSGIKLSKGGTVFGQGSGSVDSVPAMLAPGEEVIRSSAANLFRPLLKDINDNAGRMWTALSNSIESQIRNNTKQDQINNQFSDLIETFDNQVLKLIKDKRAKDIAELKEKYKNDPGTGGGTSHMHMHSSPVKPKPKSSPTSIKTYNVRKTSSAAGQPTIVNMPMPAVNLAGSQSPEQPNSNVHESSSPPISISSFDSSNPYIAESFADFGIFV